MMPPNMMPPQQGGAPGAVPAQPSPLPPELNGLPQHIAQGIDRNNPVQMELLKRASTINPQELQALKTGIAPQAAAVLKRLLPEVSFLLDMLARGGAPGGQPSAPGQNDGDADEAGTPQALRGPNDNDADENGMPRPMPAGLQRPMTRLGGI